jgi:hypothetical protein
MDTDLLGQPIPRVLEAPHFTKANTVASTKDELLNYKDFSIVSLPRNVEFDNEYQLTVSSLPAK